MENNGKEIKNLVMALVLSAIVIVATEHFFPRQKQPAIDTDTNVSSEIKDKTQTSTANEKALPPVLKTETAASAPTVESNNTSAEQSEAAKINASKNDEISRRIKIDTPNVFGSIRLVGGRIDDLKLKKYTISVDDPTPVTLLSKESSDNPYFIDLGYANNGNDGMSMPNDSTPWEAKTEILSIGKPLILSYKNASGLTFTRTFSIDNGYMITVADKVENHTGKEITLRPYGLISQSGIKTQGKASGHEGFVAFLSNKLEEVRYSELIKKGKFNYSSTGGWLGIGEKYWLTALVFDQKAKETDISAFHHKNGETDIFQADFLLGPQVVADGQSIYIKTLVFAGAKEISLLDNYTKELDIPSFDLAIDFGWYYFLTKPFLYILKFFYERLGNMGLSILLCALLLRLLMFPIASKSFENMKKMKRLHPLINEINEKYKGDQVRINQEIMAVYKEEQVNPAAGCLPMFIQIPVFFSLYKVLYIAIEMRQAPFYGWIKDLSVKDPTSVLTLFGTINWPIPEFLDIGVWPLIMGITMIIQQRLNPAPSDNRQAKIFMFLPVIFTFTLSNFAAGLVIYWAWSNILSIIQQKLIYMKMEKAETKRKEAKKKNASK